MSLRADGLIGGGGCWEPQFLLMAGLSVDVADLQWVVGDRSWLLAWSWGGSMVATGVTDG